MRSLWYNIRGDFRLINAKDAASHSAPSRTILTIASKEQRSMFQYSYNPVLSQVNSTSEGGVM